MPVQFLKNSPAAGADGLKQVDFRLGDETVPFFVGCDQLVPLMQKLKDHFAEEPFDHLFLGYDTNTEIHCAPKLEAALNEVGIPFKRCVIGITEENKTISTLDYAFETFLKQVRPAAGCPPTTWPLSAPSHPRHFLFSRSSRPQGGSRRTIVMPVGGGIVSNTYGLLSGLLFRGETTSMTSCCKFACSPIDDRTPLFCCRNQIGATTDDILECTRRSYVQEASN